MVIHSRPSHTTRYFSSFSNTNIHKQELECLRKSILLDPIIMHELSASIIVTFLYPFILTLKIYVATLIISFLSTSMLALDSQGASITYFGFLIYEYCAALAYKMFLKKVPDTKFLSYVYITMYSMTYFPVAMILMLIIGPIGQIIVFAFVLLSQYVLTNTLCAGYTFVSNTKRFLFSLLTLVLQFLFIMGLQSVIVTKTQPSELVIRK